MFFYCSAFAASTSIQCYIVISNSIYGQLQLLYDLSSNEQVLVHSDEPEKYVGDSHAMSEHSSRGCGPMIRAARTSSQSSWPATQFFILSYDTCRICLFHSESICCRQGRLLDGISADIAAVLKVSMYVDDLQSRRLRDNKTQQLA